MNFKRLALAGFILASACKKAPPQQAADPFPTKETIAGTPMIDFDSPDGKFSCLAPRNWGLQREEYLSAKKGSAFSYGNGSIVVYKFPEFENSRYSDAAEYADSFAMIAEDGKPPVVTKELIDGTTVLRFHQVRRSALLHSKTLGPPYRTDYALFPVKGGFYEIHVSNLESEYRRTLPIFEAVLRSFKPKS